MKKTTKMQNQSGPDAVAARAYEIWKTSGCPVGRDLEHWLQAEAEIRVAALCPPPSFAITLNGPARPEPVHSSVAVEREPQPVGLGRLMTKPMAIEGLSSISVFQRALNFEHGGMLPLNQY